MVTVKHWCELFSTVVLFLVNGEIKWWPVTIVTIVTIHLVETFKATINSPIILVHEVAPIFPDLM